MIHIHQMENNALNLSRLITYLESIDTIFPIPLSKKVKIAEYAEKELMHGIVLCAEAETEMVGVLLGYANDQTNHIAYLGTFGISTDFRSQGLGGHLIETMKTISKTEGMKSISLYTHVTNKRAISFYEKHGFVIQGVDASRPSDIHMCAML